MHGQVPVGLAVGGQGIPVRLFVDGPGDAPFRVIPGDPGVVPASFGREEQVRIGPELREVAVLPDHDGIIAPVSFRRVPEVLHMEGIASMGMGETGLDARG